MTLCAQASANGRLPTPGPAAPLPPRSASRPRVEKPAARRRRSRRHLRHARSPRPLGPAPRDARRRATRTRRRPARHRTGLDTVTAEGRAMFGRPGRSLTGGRPCRPAGDAPREIRAIAAGASFDLRYRPGFDRPRSAQVDALARPRCLSAGAIRDQHVARRRPCDDGARAGRGDHRGLRRHACYAREELLGRRERAAGERSRREDAGRRSSTR